MRKFAWLRRRFAWLTIVTPETAIGIIVMCHAIMAIPTMVSTQWLVARLVNETRHYRKRTPAAAWNERGRVDWR